MLTRIADLNSKFKGEKLDDELKKLKPLCPTLRNEIKSLTDEQKALTSIASVDGFLSLPVILIILGELKQQYQDDVAYQCTNLGMKNGLKGFLKENKLDKLEYVFAYFYNKSHNNVFNKLTFKEIFEKELPFDKDVTDDKIQKLYQGLVQSVLNGMFPSVSENQKEKLKSFQASLMTYLFLNHSYLMYEISDESQRYNTAELIIKVGTKQITKNKIEKAYQSVVLGAKYLVPSKETVPLWKEAGLWLQGLYKRTYDVLPHELNGDVKKDPDGTYPVVKNDDHDIQMKDNLKITKYQISTYHKGFADSIFAALPKQETKLVVNPVTPKLELVQKEVEAKLNVQTPEKVHVPESEAVHKQVQPTQSTATDIEKIVTPIVARLENQEIHLQQQQKDVPTIMTKPNDPVQQPPNAVEKPALQMVEPMKAVINNYDPEKIMEDDDNLYLTIKIPKTKKMLVSQIKEFTESKLNSGREIVDDMLIPREMHTVKDSTDEMLIGRLHFCIKNYELTTKQMIAVQSMINREVDMYFNNYINSANKPYYLYSHSAMWQPVHIEDAKTTLLEIMDMQNPQSQLERLLDFQKKLIVDSSNNLLPNVNKILLGVCHYFIDRLKLVNEDSVTMKRVGGSKN